ncbi:hypothetical protein M9H77_06532 [Catharanthus roseus]|uniref:Uncharacterized protein n=1 Tax=Catharanthus roseus TaxID=4058 RepID=A0ACC0BSL8_CATRO|nr:hypothetical protein M9H77_06532 [Catharanthus roseus]
MWQPDTNSFHMPWGEMLITLHDVELILGVPAYGAVVDHRLSREQLIRVVQDDLGLALTGGLGFNATELHAVATSRQTSQSHQVRAACYLQYILGTSLFSDKSDNIVPARLWPLLQDVSSVGRFAWGAACLAYLYQNLGQTSKVNAKELAGCWSLLEA